MTHQIYFLAAVSFSVISNHNCFRVLFAIKLLPYILFDKCFRVASRALKSRVGCCCHCHLLGARQFTEERGRLLAWRAIIKYCHVSFLVLVGVGGIRSRELTPARHGGRSTRLLLARAFQFAIRIDSIRFVMRIDSNLFVL